MYIFPKQGNCFKPLSSISIAQFKPYFPNSSQRTHTCSSPSNSYSNLAKRPSMSSFPPPEIREVVKEVVGLLKERKESVAVGETAAGGIVSASILSVPGASGIFKGGLTLYTLESRIAFAGWTQANIQNYKGPTQEVCKGLAENIRSTLGSTYVIVESGTAGPTGGNTPNRTPGFVALAISTEKGTYTKDLNTGLGGDREKNMVAFAVAAMSFLKEVIKGDAKL